MSLLQMAALGGVERSSSGIAQKIRTEAEQAFKARMVDDSQDHDKDMQEGDQSHQIDMQENSQNFTGSENEKDRDHSESRDAAGREHESGLLAKKLDHTTAENAKDRKSAVAVASAKGGAKSDPERVKKYKLAIETHQNEWSKLMDAGEYEAAQAVQTEINRLNTTLQKEMGVLSQPAAAPTKEQILSAAMARYPDKSRDTIIEQLKQDQQYGHLFQDETAQEPEQQTSKSRSNGGGILNTGVVG